MPIIYIVFFNAEALRTQRIAEKKAIDSAVLRDLRVENHKNQNTMSSSGYGTSMALKCSIS